MNKSELESNLSRVHEWIRAGDQKISIFLAFQGVVMTLLLPYIIQWYRFLVCNSLDVSLVLLIAGSVLALYSLYLSWAAIIPQTNHGHFKKSILFFKDIATFELEDYRKRIEHCQDQDYIDELIMQTHASAKVAARKHVQFRDSGIVFFVALTALLCAIVFVLF